MVIAVVMETQDTTPSTYSGGSKLPLEYDKDYIFTIDSILKAGLAVNMVSQQQVEKLSMCMLQRGGVCINIWSFSFQLLGIITLICALIPPWGSSGSWVEFVSSSTMIFMILLWFFYFFQLENRIKRCGVPIRMVVSVASICQCS